MLSLVRRSARLAAPLRAAASRPAGAAVALAASQPLQASRRTFASTSESESEASHSDFAPKYHAAKSSEKDEILKMIESHVKTYPVMLYMKGTPSAPQCGFSMQVVRILHGQGVSFDSVNVLDHPEIRDGVKEYSCVRCLVVV